MGRATDLAEKLSGRELATGWFRRMIFGPRTNERYWCPLCQIHRDPDGKPSCPEQMDESCVAYSGDQP